MSASITQKKILNGVNFSNRISPKAYLVYDGIKDYNIDILDSQLTLMASEKQKDKIKEIILNNNDYSCPLYKLITELQPKHIISKAEANMIKLVLLESMYVYIELYKMGHEVDTYTPTLTLEGIVRLIKNVQYLCFYFSLNGTADQQFYTHEIIIELRKLEKVLYRAKTEVIAYL